MQRRSFLQGTTASLLAASAPALAQPARARTLRFVPQANLTILDPIITTASVTTAHGYCVFDTLYGVDAQLRPQPQMAEGTEVSDDGLTYSIRLRDGLKFHDGEPVRGSDCATSLRRWSQRDSFGQALAAAVGAWEAPDDRTVRIRLRRPFPHLLRAIAKPHSSPAFMMPERLAKTDVATQITEMVGSGPFRFVADEYLSGSRVVYARFDGYQPRSEPASWSAGGKQVHFDRLEWVVIPDSATAAASLKTGEIDWWEAALSDLVPSLSQTRGVVVTSLDPFGLILGLRFNHVTPPFDNVKLRQAILSAVTQDDYLQATSGGDPKTYRQCLAMFPCGLPGVTELGSEMMRQPPDLARARAAVAASGYRGEKVVILNPTDNQYIIPLGEITADLLRKLGMNVELQTMDWGTVTQRRTSREPVERGGWSIFHTTWPGSSVTNPAENLYIRGAGANGWFGWHANPELEEQTTAWLNAGDAQHAQLLLDDIQRSAFRSVPIVPLGQLFPPTAYRGLRDILPASAPFFWNVRRA
jgi:peptide/nickel transport system substrate-binding protein